MIDIEIVETKSITNMKSFKNGIVSIEKLEKFVNNIAIRNREFYFTDREEFKKILDEMLEDVYTSGYENGRRENGTERRVFQSGNNWDAGKVYPKDSIRD